MIAVAYSRNVQEEWDEDGKNRRGLILPRFLSQNQKNFLLTMLEMSLDRKVRAARVRAKDSSAIESKR